MKDEKIVDSYTILSANMSQQDPKEFEEIEIKPK